MGSYMQLTQDQRYQIYAFLKAGFSQSFTTSEIGIHKPIVSRELSRNRGQKGSRPTQVHRLALEMRREPCKFAKMTSQVIPLIEDLIRQDFCPEQVCGFLCRQNNIRISHESIYRHVLKDRVQGGDLYLHLRHSHKKRKKRYGADVLKKVFIP